MRSLSSLTVLAVLGALSSVHCGDDDEPPLGDVLEEDTGTADTAVTDTGPAADTTTTGSAFPPAGASLVFAAIGDFGDTTDLDDFADTETAKVAALIKSWRPDFIITVGDNDYTDAEFEGTNRGLELGVGQYFHEFIGNYQGSEGEGASTNNFFPVPGDHDYGDDCDNPRLADYLEYFTLPAGPVDETFYTFRRGPVEFYAIDSVVDCHQDGGAKMTAQRTWLEATATASDAPFKIAYFHHPAYSSGERHGSAEYMQWPFADWGVQLTLSGDDHVYERLEKDGVTYLVNGLGGVDTHPFGTPLPESVARFTGEYGAVGMAVVGDALHVSFLDIQGTVHDTFVLGNETPVDPAAYDLNAPPITSGDWYRPPVETTWQWQLQGTLNTTYDVDLYDIDLFDTPATTIASLQGAGRKVICYFSAGTYEPWREDAGQFVEADLGDPLADFADERWLDIRSPNVHAIMKARLDLAVTRGCDGVEPDNVDSYTNEPGLPLTADDQLTYNRFIANQAHTRGLSVALKNDLDQVEALVDYFDFAINEQCHEYEECSVLAPFTAAGKAVLVAEYQDRFVNPGPERDAMCANALAAGLRVLGLSWDLDDSLRFSCDAP